MTMTVNIGRIDIPPSCVNIVFVGLVFPCPTLVCAAALIEYSVNTVRLKSLKVELLVLTDKKSVFGSNLVCL